MLTAATAYLYGGHTSHACTHEISRRDAEVAFAMVSVLVEERSARRLVERRERCQRVRLREAVLAAERVSPNEGRHVRPAAGHESFGGEDALVRSVGSVRPALLRVGEVARVAVLHAHVVEAFELETLVRDHLRVWVVAEQVDVRYADWWHGRRGFLHL